MKEKKKVKGGKRAGSGRKPSGRQKEAVTVYIDTSKRGDKEGARAAIYEFWEQLPDPEKKFPPSDREVKRKGVPLPDGYIKFSNVKAVKPDGTVIADLTQPTHVLKPQEQPKTNFSINTAPDQKIAPVDVLRNMDIEEKIQAIKSEKCPKERDTTLGKKSWELEQRKRIQELENQLK